MYKMEDWTSARYGFSIIYESSSNNEAHIQTCSPLFRGALNNIL